MCLLFNPKIMRAFWILNSVKEDGNVSCVGSQIMAKVTRVTFLAIPLPLPLSQAFSETNSSSCQLNPALTPALIKCLPDISALSVISLMCHLSLEMFLLLLKLKLSSPFLRNLSQSLLHWTFINISILCFSWSVRKRKKELWSFVRWFHVIYWFIDSLIHSFIFIPFRVN